MSGGFQVGDVVVRIRVNPADFPLRMAINKSLFPIPPYGKMMRVAAVYNGPGWQALVFDAFPSEHSTRGWHGKAFRKIEAPRTELSDRIRACKPQRVPA